MTTDRTMLITGATSGLGRELARQYSLQPGHLIVHGRDPDKLTELIDDLSPARARIDAVTADLADLAQVERLAQEVAGLTGQVSVLVNNAGVGQGRDDVRETSADGHELRLAVNHLAPFLLTMRLLPLLEAGAPSRVVNVASAAQTPFDFDDPQLTEGYTGSRAYAHSKFAMVTAGFRLAQRLSADKVTVNSLHPATLMPTAMVEEGWGANVDKLATGVSSTRHLIDSPRLHGVTGQYFFRKSPEEALPQAYDRDVQDRLWRLSEELTGLA